MHMSKMGDNSVEYVMITQHKVLVDAQRNITL